MGKPAGNASKTQRAPWPRVSPRVQRGTDSSPLFQEFSLHTDPTLGARLTPPRTPHLLKRFQFQEMERQPCTTPRSDLKGEQDLLMGGGRLRAHREAILKVVILLSPHHLANTPACSCRAQDSAYWGAGGGTGVPQSPLTP